MSQICLLDLNENDKFSTYSWESDWIKALSFEGDCPNEFGIEIFEFKKRFSTKRVPTKKGLEFCVIIDVFHSDDERGFSDVMKEKTEAKAIDTFIALKEEMEFFKKQQDKGRFFDGRRYFWKLTEDGNITDRGWD